MLAPVSTFQALRTEIARIEAHGRRPRGVLPFGIERLDRHLPTGGLILGALHEVAGGGEGAIDGAAAALFAAGIAARTQGPVLWCVTRPDLFAPALQQAGLSSNRVIYVETGDDAGVLAAAEDGLRHGGFGAVIAETSRLSMTASRRLQLVAEESGTLALAIRRWKRQAQAADFGQPTAAATRWRVTARPSSRLPFLEPGAFGGTGPPRPVAGVGRARWFVELIRCRAGDCADFELEACDETGRLALPADLADRSVAPATWDRRAVA